MNLPLVSSADPLAEAAVLSAHLVHVRTSDPRKQRIIHRLVYATIAASRCAKGFYIVGAKNLVPKLLAKCTVCLRQKMQAFAPELGVSRMVAAIKQGMVNLFQDVFLIAV